MSENPKIFRLRLTTLSPIHVGTGETFDFTQLTIDIQNNLLYTFNLFDLVNSLTRAEREELERIADTPSAEALVKLQKFYYYRLLPKIIKLSRRSYEIPLELTRAFERTLSLNREREIYTQFNSMAIRSQFSDLYSTNPLIPGSSLKGALRTGYLEGLYKVALAKFPERIKPVNDLVNSINNEPSYRRHKGEAFQRLEEILLRRGRRGIQFDPFKTLKLSDLAPVKDVPTKVCFALNLRKQNPSTTGRLYVPLEVIPPGAIFEGTLKIVSSLDDVRPISIEVLRSSNHSHYRAILKEEVESLPHFKTLLGERLKPFQGAINQNRAIFIKIGHHSGASAVTIEGLRKILVKTRGGRKIIRDSATTFWVASPSKNDLSKAEPFGWAVLEFLDL